MPELKNSPSNVNSSLFTVLRCPPSSTISFEKEMRVDHGMLAWTPIRWVNQRLPRRRGRRWIMTSVLPSFIFIPSRELKIFLDLPWPYNDTIKPMIVNGRVVEVTDQELVPLEGEDTRRKDPDSEKQTQIFHVFEKVGIRWGTLAAELFGIAEGEIVGNDGRGSYLVAVENSARPVWLSGSHLERLSS